MYFGASGIDAVAKAICGNERIDMGVRPFGFHAGNMASTIVYMDLLCKKTLAFGKKISFHVSFCLSDTEQYKTIGHPFSPQNTHLGNIYPDGKTIQFTMCSQKPDVSVVDAWLPVYENALTQLGEKWPSLSWNVYKTSDLKKHNNFKNILLTTIENPDDIATVIEEATGEKVYKPAQFVRAICPLCKTPVPNTKIKQSGMIAIEDHQCHTAHSAGEYSYDVLEYWTHPTVAIVAEWASLEKFDIAICGYDHYASKSEKAWFGLAKYYGIENKISNTIRLYAPLILSFDGRKMGKSNSNVRYMSTSLMGQFLEKSNELVVQFPEKNLSSDISSCGISVPQYLRGYPKDFDTSMKKLAFTHEEQGAAQSELHKNPAETLKYAVELRSDDKFICIELNASQVVHTYTQIWESAGRRLAGLRSLGLQPNIPLILQVDTNPDFAPALWSCIMGGFVPVLVPIASDYSKSNQALSRLYNIWQQLDYPTILTTSKLASQVHTGLQLYGKENVKIATIEEIEAHSPDPRLHKLQPHELALLLPSSGTTGKPKLIEINSHTFIYRFLRNAINQNNNGSPNTFLSWFPLESISGILTTTPNGFHKNIYLPVELIIHDPLLWLDILSKHRVTHAQTTNLILARVIDELSKSTPRDWDFSSLQKIGIGAEPIVVKTARSFIEILGKYKLHPNVLYPAYGMTECGPIAGSSEGLSLTNTSDSDRFVEIGKPARGHSIRIVDQQGCILEEGQIGRIQVTGPSMTSGYYQAPELTRELFTEDGWINTGDLGFLQDGKLTVTGREKEIIIINARNYSCHEIELVAEEVEGVEPSYTAACAIRQSNSETDELVIFFYSLVSKESHLSQLLKQIRRNIAEKLGINPTYLIPIEKSTIPRTATGKIQRLQLKQRFDAGEFQAICQQVEVLTNQEQESNFVAPRENLELEVAKIWEQVLGKQPIGVRDNFFDLGGDSLLAVRLLAQIEKAFGKNLPLTTLFQSPTVEQQAKILHQSGWSSPWFSLVPIQPSGSQPPFFGIHSLGKGQEHYRNIARHLGSDQPIYGLDYWLATQTKDTKEPPKTWSVEELAAHYIKEMRILQPEGPYFLAGSSFAGIVAYEMAQQLVMQNQKVALLVLFDTRCPTLSVKSLDFNSLEIHLRNLSQLEMKEKLAYIMMKVNYKIEHYIKSIKPFFRKMSEKFYLKFKLPMPYALHYSLILEANQKLASDYALQVYPGKVTLFRASDQPVSYDQFSDLGWSAMAVGGVEIHEVPGDHMAMFQEPHVQVLAEKLRVCIDKALQDVSEKE